MDNTVINFFDILPPEEGPPPAKQGCTRRTFLKSTATGLGLNLIPASALMLSGEVAAEVIVPPTLRCVKRGCRPTQRADKSAPDVCGRCPHYR